MNRIGVALLVWPLMAPGLARAQNAEPQAGVDRQVKVTVLRGPGEAGLKPLLAAGGMDVDFMTMPLAIGGESVTGAPYSAEAVTEVVQTLADGNRISRQSHASVYRDSAGRTRREQGLAVLGNAVAGADRRTQVQIHDPESGAIYLIDLDRKIAHPLPSPTILLSQRTDRSGPPRSPDALPPLPPLSAGGAAMFQRDGTATFNVQLAAPTGDTQNTLYIRGGAVTAPSASQVEQLGKRFFDGVEADGTRSTTTIPAGQIGNELPIEVVSEQWFSSELKVLIMSRQSDPRFGETTYQLTDIVRSEPTADLFQVPPDFTIVGGEMKK
jgi:hypothetical protein